MSYLFYNCISLSSLPDISKWNIDNVINMDNLFSYCQSLSCILDILKWKTNNILNIFQLFTSCIALLPLTYLKKFEKSKIIQNNEISKNEENIETSENEENNEISKNADNKSPGIKIDEHCHNLVYMITNRDWECDLCIESYPNIIPTYYCTKCDFDVCKNCMNNLSDEIKYPLFYEGKKENNDIKGINDSRYHCHPLIYCITSRNSEEKTN